MHTKKGKQSPKTSINRYSIQADARSWQSVIPRKARQEGRLPGQEQSGNVHSSYLCILQRRRQVGKNFQNKLNESIFNQISAFKICYHKNFCKLVDIFHDEKYFYIITEKNSEINILEYLRNLGIHNPFKEEEKICEIIHQLLIAVYYLHKMGILHRNIKPDSIVPNR